MEPFVIHHDMFGEEEKEDGCQMEAQQQDWGLLSTWEKNPLLWMEVFDKNYSFTKPVGLEFLFLRYGNRELLEKLYQKGNFIFSREIILQAPKCKFPMFQWICEHSDLKYQDIQCILTTSCLERKVQHIEYILHNYHIPDDLLDKLLSIANHIDNQQLHDLLYSFCTTELCNGGSKKSWEWTLCDFPIQ